MSIDIIDNVFISGKKYFAENGRIVSVTDHDWAWCLDLDFGGSRQSTPAYGTKNEIARKMRDDLAKALGAETLAELVGEDCYVLYDAPYGRIRGVISSLESTEFFLFPEN